jgi:hypothetical protein
MWQARKQLVCEGRTFSSESVLLRPFVIVLVLLDVNGVVHIVSYVNDLAAAICTACTAVPGGLAEQWRSQ